MLGLLDTKEDQSRLAWPLVYKLALCVDASLFPTTKTRALLKARNQVISDNLWRGWHCQPQTSECKVEAKEVILL